MSGEADSVLRNLKADGSLSISTEKEKPDQKDSCSFISGKMAATSRASSLACRSIPRGKQRDDDPADGFVGWKVHGGILLSPWTYSMT